MLQWTYRAGHKIDPMDNERKTNKQFRSNSFSLSTARLTDGKLERFEIQHEAEKKSEDFEIKFGLTLQTWEKEESFEPSFGFVHSAVDVVVVRMNESPGNSYTS